MPGLNPFPPPTSPTSPSPTSPHHRTRFLSVIFPSQRQLFRIFAIALCISFVAWSVLISVHSTSPSVVLPDQTLDTAFDPSYEINLPQFTNWENGGESWNHQEGGNHSIFLDNLKTYIVKGHNSTELNQLIQPTEVQTAITAVLTENEFLEQQIAAVRAQSLAVRDIVIVCISSACFQQQRNANTHAATRVMLAEQPRSDFPKGSAGGSAWLQIIHTIDADWIWAMDGQVLPGPHYLEYVYSLMQTTDYKDALLGSLATLLPANLNYNKDENVLCLPDDFGVVPQITQPVDMIHGAWLLPRSWLGLLNDHRKHILSVPVSYYISWSLRHAGISSIVIPPHEDQSYQLSWHHSGCGSVKTLHSEKNQWKLWLSMHSSPTALDQRQSNFLLSISKDTVVILMDGPEQAVALQPLICRFEYPVHIVLTGAQRGLSGFQFRQALQQSSCKNRDMVMVHDLDIAASGVTTSATQTVASILQLAQLIRPTVLIHIHDNQPFYFVVDAMTEAQGIVTIGLPPDQVHHALWIADIQPTALKYWNMIDIDIVVVTNNRPHSLSRLLQSVNDAYYLGDKANLKIHLEQSADQVTRLLVHDFRWRHGKKTLRHRIRKGGLMPAITESWYPNSNHNYGVLLEDDIEVSPLFYVWTKYNILRYRYGDDEKEAALSMFGISLYSPRHLELLPQGRVKFDPETAIGSEYPERTPYLCQVPCSWGAVYFPEHWREFHKYLTGRLEDIENGNAINITVPNSRSTRWRQSWKKYIIELIYLRGYVMLYPNFQEFESFSTNHLEMGTHVSSGKHAISQFLVPLMERDTILSQLPQQRLPSYPDLPVLDLWGVLTNAEALDTIGAKWHVNVTACPRSTGQFDPSDLLCPFPDNARRAMESVKLAKKKKPKPVKLPGTVQPVVYVKKYTNKAVQDQDGDLPTPINVAQLKSPPLDHIHQDGELLDMETDFKVLKKLAVNL